MKLSCQWLEEWVENPWEARELGARLTMAGFELEGIESSGGDSILELNVTPNRGDAMSVLGLAREVAALSGKTLTGPAIAAVPAVCPDVLAVHLDAPASCPRFAGRVIRGLNNRAASPAWLRERLERSGVRSISPIVDVTNYVLLELGQPMHAYDLARLEGEIHVRAAQAAERVTLLDARSIELTADVLVIADDRGAIGLAGIMGGERTAVSAGTSEVFLEVAFFEPSAIAGRARRFGLLTDASQRFERGVDPSQQERAMERATALIVEIAGGSPGPLILTHAPAHEPRRPTVSLRRAQLARLLGFVVEPLRVEAALSALQMHVRALTEGWEVIPPPHRFDINIEADLIEEIARIVGFAAIPETPAPAARRFASVPESQPPEAIVLAALAARGFQEAINFSFVDPALQRRLFPERTSLALVNPIANDLSTMRVSLWPGLLRAVAENQRRQQGRVRLFEHGARFEVGEEGVVEIDTLAGIACGSRLPEQWGLPREMRVPVDFFDVKADLEALAIATGAEGEWSFEPVAIDCLHPGRAARVLRLGHPVGTLGELHPTVVRELDFTYPPVLFELDFRALTVLRPSYRPVSRFPQLRRDLAVVVDEEVSLSALRERVTLAAPSLVRQCRVFDVYRGPGIETGRKSIALGLIFQDISRTLTDEDADRAFASIVADLRVSVNAKIRE